MRVCLWLLWRLNCSSDIFVYLFRFVCIVIADVHMLLCEQLLSNGSLFISQVYMEDDGKYSCTVGNVGGLDQEDAYLHVARTHFRSVVHFVFFLALITPVLAHFVMLCYIQGGPIKSKGLTELSLNLTLKKKPLIKLHVFSHQILE